MARERILAVTPYFVPDATLLMALTLAARRGVAVDLVLPARSNHRLADVARNRPLRDLARAGARIWLTSHMVHAKAIVIDDGFALAGSANLDARSLFLNYELMVAFYRPADVAEFAGLDRRRASSRQRLSRADAGPHPRPCRRSRALARVSTLRAAPPGSHDGLQAANGVEVEKGRLITSSPASDSTCRSMGCTLAV